MRRTLNSPKTGHASQRAYRIGPYGHSIPGRIGQTRAERHSVARKPAAHIDRATFQYLYRKEDPCNA